MPRPNVLIEDWLPFEAIGAESQRERGASNALPPIYYLHVWWARRPLMTSRAAVLASLLPVWSNDWPAQLQDRFPTKESYYDWFTRFLGIRGDPVAGRKLLNWSKQTGTKLKVSPYNAPRAFAVNPDPNDLQLMGDLLEWTWGTREAAVMDVTAGGGSIPFEALRYGFTTYANELNPVASVILKATLDYPARFGKPLADDIRKWGKIWSQRVGERLSSYFLKQADENIFAYLWARTVACPYTGKPVPLSPNWWLSRENEGTAAQIVVKPEWDQPRFVIGIPGSTVPLDGTAELITIGNPDRGTISRGVAVSPWTNEAIEGDYIKSEAQAGRMGQMLYAVAIKEQHGFNFRAPTDLDQQSIAHAENDLRINLPRWESEGLFTNEEIPVGNKTDEPRRYGMYHWSGMFSPRQLRSMLMFIEMFHEVTAELRQVMDTERAAAIEVYLSFAIDKSADRNSYQTRWIPQRSVIANTFDRHDFAMKWSFAEFDSASNLLPWTVEQIAKAYGELTDLAIPAQYSLWGGGKHQPIQRLNISKGSATDLRDVADGAIHNITFDPPYYDNVMYAELSDFFYVWLKRSVGHLFPKFFEDTLTNKDDEAVANVARFADMGRNKKKLAEQDYERKMLAIFRECSRVLNPDGVLTIMFTHKRVEAWDTLASALINAGFVVKASWPIHTEFENSLHQAKKNAAASTILLTCRKRHDDGEPVWWDDIKGRVKRVAREKAAEFAAQGISGVDLYISTFGPALSVISEQWPVLTSEVDPKTGDPIPLRPETALDLAREEVVSLRKQGLLLGRDIDFDPITDWYLMAWDAFKAVEFPYDEARKLAIALGVDLDGDIRGHKNLVARKTGSVVLQEPKQRRKQGMVDPEVAIFESMVDAVHTALLVLDEDGTRACESFLNRSGLMSDGTFKQCIQAMINAIPRTRVKGKWVRPEAELLENLRLNFFPDVEVPQEEEPPHLPQQLSLDMDEPLEEEYADEDETGEDDE